MMRVLIACEFSGVVRDAFVRAGHDAISCDLLPSETKRPDGYDGHYQGDVCQLLDEMKIGRYEFDLMIAHPPCTYLCNSGVRWLYGGKGKTVDKKRWQKMQEASQFFCLLLATPIERIAIENPIMHRHAGIRKPDQIVQPYQFGHGETKATCLWLKNLPLLKPTNIVTGRVPRVHYASPACDRWKERSRTYLGIAEAMVKQWGIT